MLWRTEGQLPQSWQKGEHKGKDSDGQDRGKLGKQLEFAKMATKKLQK